MGKTVNMPYQFREWIRVPAALLLILSCSATKIPVPMPAAVPPVTAAQPADTTKTSVLLENLLKSGSAQLAPVLQNPAKFNLQVIYTQVDRGANGVPKLTHHYFNVNPARYFYPASTVKLPVVALALQRLNELAAAGIDRNTTMITEAGDATQTAVYNDATTADGRPTIAQYIKKILLVSDNDAYNRLYEFLGQEYINNQLHLKGYRDVQLLHRLNIFLSEEENRRTNPVQFLDDKRTVLYRQPLQRNAATYLPRNDSMGRGYLKGGQLQNGPMDFSKKNRISLEDLHQVLISLVFPQQVPAAQRFNITEDDRNFLLKYMSQFPTESTFPDYASDTTYWPAYGKFILMGGEKGPQPEWLRSFNKTGDAYGQLIDIAYIADLKNNVEFFVSATIYCNEDGILNDDQYDYKTIGLPFMKTLGELLHNYELKRERKIKPDLSGFIFTYDK